MLHDTLTDAHLAWAEPVTDESGSPIPSLKRITHSRHDARQETTDAHLSSLGVQARFLVAPLQAHLVGQEAVRVKWL
jgi:hypothetical protein